MLFRSAGMRRWMMEMKPHSLDNAVAMVALFRPGPMDFIPTYIKRMHKEEPVEYAHPDLEPIFEETYGIAVYQEQLMRAAMDLAGYTASDADDLRKAIAKKIEAKLRKHRKQFAKGAVKKGIAESAAEAIFDDWQNFARYGFNKAHAADYGHLAVQTAYLKAHYPVEYMTALLSVSKSDSDKVAFYIHDCQRMGIDVLPPDINSSLWDFSIEDQEDGSHIRFGLGAIKNVGHASVEAIMNGRQDQPFVSLEELAKRVDFRAVGKRALEYLIRAGALDAFGERHVLLEAMDQLVSISSTHFQAKESGQLTFFGGDAGLKQEIHLRPSSMPAELARREMLNWERELIGLYVSDHPLSPMREQLREIVTHFSSELAVLTGEERVRVAGMVSSMRSFQTKTGKQMAFAAIEDLQGQIDLVIFPGVWKDSGTLVQMDKLLVVEGRLDPQSSEPKILVDRIETQVDLVTPLAAAPQLDNSAAPPPQADPAPAAELDLEPDSEPETDAAMEPGFLSDDDPDSDEITDNQQATPTSAQIAEAPEQDYALQAPDPFPPDWDSFIAAIDVPAAPSPEPALAENKSPEPPREEAKDSPDENSPQAPSDDPGEFSLTSPANLSPAPGLQPVQDARPEMPPPLVEAPAAPSAKRDRPPKLITITLRNRGDKARDVLHMRRIHGTLISYPGEDHFAFYVIEGRSGFLMEFPNDTTAYSEELRQRLNDLVGENNIRVETITYQ